MLGEQPAHKISAILSKASLRFATTAFALVDESGFVAAMNVHKLPVLCVSLPWIPRGMAAFMPPQGIIAYRAGNFEACMMGKIDMTASWDVADIAASMNHSLIQNGH